MNYLALFEGKTYSEVQKGLIFDRLYLISIMQNLQSNLKNNFRLNIFIKYFLNFKMNLPQQEVNAIRITDVGVDTFSLTLKSKYTKLKFGALRNNRSFLGRQLVLYIHFIDLRSFQSSR